MSKARESGTAGSPVDKALDFRGSSRQLLRMLQPERRLMIWTTLLTVGSVLATAIGPKILGDATNVVFDGAVSKRFPPGVSQAQVVERLRAQGKGQLAGMLSAMHLHPGHGIDFGTVGRILGVVTMIYLTGWVLGVIAGRITATIAQRSVLRLREQVQAKLARLPLAYFDSQPRGDMLSRVTNDIDNIGQTLQQTLGQMLNSVLTVVGMLAMMIWVSWLLALVALVTVPASAWVAKRIAVRSRPQFVKQWAAMGALNGHVEELYTGHALVKVFGRQAEAAATFHEHNEKLYAASFWAQSISSLMQPALTFLGNINYVLIAVIGGLRVAAGAMSIGDVQAFILYSRWFSQPMTQVANMANLLLSGVASFERVNALLEAPEQEPDPAEPAEITRPRGRVAFEHVSFRYQPDAPLIEDLSLVVEPGQTVAIVGPTGAGKTTLVNLLMRFYEVPGGRITIDGTDIAAMTRDKLRSLTGMVLQDTWLFGGSIADNIAYGADGASHEQIVAAARATHVDHFVRCLPDGYHTVIDDEGGTVSAGEKQLITIARAFVSDPVILILDEATSSVDTRTELLIQRGMNELRRGRTSFVIAHRLSTIREADLILVMDDGRIVESGTHQQLLAAGGTYQRLCQVQFDHAAAEVV